MEKEQLKKELITFYRAMHIKLGVEIDTAVDISIISDVVEYMDKKPPKKNEYLN